MSDIGWDARRNQRILLAGMTITEKLCDADLRATDQGLNWTSTHITTDMLKDHH